MGSQNSANVKKVALEEGEVLKGTFAVIKRLRTTKHGQLFQCVNDQFHPFAVKIHPGPPSGSKASDAKLRLEVACLRRLRGRRHFVELIQAGKTDKFSYLVVSMVGQTLTDILRSKPWGRLDRSAALDIACQVLSGIREMHDVGYIHRDIQPRHIAMGQGKADGSRVYILGCGSARFHLDPETGSPRAARDHPVKMRGSVHFTSCNGNRGLDMGRVDDLWSLLYLLVFMLEGSLPWKHLHPAKNLPAITAMKSIPFPELMDDRVDCREAISEVAKYLGALGYADTPDYDWIMATLLDATYGP